MSGKVEFALFNVDGNDGGASARSGEGTGEKTDGTSADDKDSRTRTEVSSSVSVENDGEGFGKSSEGEFKVRGEPREKGDSVSFSCFFEKIFKGSRACLLRPNELTCKPIQQATS